jgi:hypothetical protein
MEQKRAAEEARQLFAQLLFQAELKFGADLADFHAFADHELTAQQFVRFILVGELRHDAAILAILVPAEAPVGNRLRADVLEAAEDRVFFRDFKRLPENLDRD